MTPQPTTITRSVATGRASCRRCDWKRSYGTLTARRRAAYKHIEETGHHVVVQVEKTYVYGPRQ